MSGEWPQVRCSERLPSGLLSASDAVRLASRTLAATWVCESRELRLSVYFCADSEMREMHELWLGDEAPTDVMSFPLDEEAHGVDAAQGELVISVEFASQQAIAYDNSLHAELSLYVAHGALHLLGYDDHDANALREMQRAEQRVLEQLGLRVRGRHDDTHDDST